MQTEDGVVPQGYPATGQQPAYVLLQVTRNKTFSSDTNEMNPSLNKQSSRQCIKCFFLVQFVCQEANELLFRAVQCLQQKFLFWSKVIHDYIDCKRVYFRKVLKGKRGMNAVIQMRNTQINIFSLLVFLVLLFRLQCVYQAFFSDIRKLIFEILRVTYI